MGIDKRRRNKSQENLQRNVQRLKEYRSKLVILPRSGSTDIEQIRGTSVMPVDPNPASKIIESAVISDEDRKGSVYQAFHMAKANSKWAGQREKRRLAREAAAAEKAGRKK